MRTVTGRGHKTTPFSPDRIILLLSLHYLSMIDQELTCIKCVLSVSGISVFC